MKPKAMVWDIDDVLTPTSVTFYQNAVRTHGPCLHPDHWSDYLWGRHIDTPEGYETAQYLIKHRIIETTLPYSYTALALSLVHALGYQNIFLSARDWHPDPQKVTQTWSYEHGFDRFVHEMHFVTVEESKRAMLERLCEAYNVVGYADDNASHALCAVGLIPNIFLVRKGWNKAHHESSFLKPVDTAWEAAQFISNI